jgi:4,5-dihydroxyphthalate decarboxylase
MKIMSQTAALKGMLPWFNAHVEEAKQEMGEDFWPYGYQKNEKVIDTFLRYHFEQGLSKHQLKASEIFAPETMESFKI